MADRKSWREVVDERLKTDPDFRAGYEKAKRELDTAWQITCRYGNCVIFVSPDSNVREDLGGWGPIFCLCKAGEWEDE